jgi:hypothetical protein
MVKMEPRSYLPSRHQLRESAMKDTETQPPYMPQEQTASRAENARRPYTPPRLECLGEWSALTLQQSIPIGPGNW